MRCKNCGYELERDALYCTHCGKYTGRHPRTQNPIFLKRVIAWLLLLVAALLLMNIMFGVLIMNMFQTPQTTDLMPSFPKETAMPTVSPTLAPTPLPRGAEVTTDYPVSEKKKLNMMLSAFSIAGVDAFTQESGDADVETMLRCAFLYYKRNKKSAVVVDESRQYLSEDLMGESCKQLFGIEPDPESVGDFMYENKRFYVSSSEKPKTMFAQLTAIYKNDDGTYTVDMDIYDYGDEAFSSEYYNPKSRWTEDFDVKRVAQATAVMRGLEGNGNKTIISYQQEKI